MKRFLVALAALAALFTMTDVAAARVQWKATSLDFVRNRAAFTPTGKGVNTASTAAGVGGNSTYIVQVNGSVGAGIGPATDTLSTMSLADFEPIPWANVKKSAGGAGSMQSLSDSLVYIGDLVLESDSAYTTAGNTITAATVTVYRAGRTLTGSAVGITTEGSSSWTAGFSSLAGRTVTIPCYVSATNLINNWPLPKKVFIVLSSMTGAMPLARATFLMPTSY